jgi:acetyltransferase-like isoleucine patch superfamily enzyme
MFGENLRVGKNCDISKSAFLDADVTIGDNCKIGNNVTLRSVSIGDNTIVEDSTQVGYCNIRGPYYAQKQYLTDEHDTSRTRQHVVVIGNNVLIRTGVTVYLDVTIGDNCWINHNVLIMEGASILEDTSIGSHTTIDRHVRIGKRCAIQGFTTVSAEVESCVFIGPVVAFTNNSPIAHLRDNPDTIRLPKLRWGCAIGGGVTICPGVEIGQEAIVAAGAVVVKDVMPRIIVAGNPAKKIRDVDSRSLIREEIRRQYGI